MLKYGLGLAEQSRSSVLGATEVSAFDKQPLHYLYAVAKLGVYWIFASRRPAISPTKAEPLPNLGRLFLLYYAEQGRQQVPNFQTRKSCEQRNY